MCYIIIVNYRYIHYIRYNECVMCRFLLFSGLFSYAFRIKPVMTVRSKFLLFNYENMQDPSGLVSVQRIYYDCACINEHLKASFLF